MKKFLSIYLFSFEKKGIICNTNSSSFYKPPSSISPSIYDNCFNVLGRYFKRHTLNTFSPSSHLCVDTTTMFISCVHIARDDITFLLLFNFVSVETLDKFLECLINVLCFDSLAIRSGLQQCRHSTCRLICGHTINLYFFLHIFLKAEWARVKNWYYVIICARNLISNATSLDRMRLALNSAEWVIMEMSDYDGIQPMCMCSS